MAIISRYLNKILPKNSANAAARNKFAAKIKAHRVMQKTGHGPNVRKSLIKKIIPKVRAANAAAKATHAEKLTRLAKTSHSTTVGIATKKPRRAALKNHTTVVTPSSSRRVKNSKTHLLKTKSFST